MKHVITGLDPVISLQPADARIKSAHDAQKSDTQIEIPSASLRFRDEGGVERHLTVAPTFRFNKMVRGRSTPVIFGGHFHVTRFGMFRSRAGLALNPWSTAASPRLPTGTGPISTLKASSGQRLLHGAG